MIEVLGLNGSSEFRAAQLLRDRLKSLWPGIENTLPEEDRVVIASNIKLSGYKISDVDIVMCASFKRPRYFVPTGVLKDEAGQSLVGIKIRVENLVAALEVKDQDAGAIRVAGNEVYVRYSDGWKDATQQNIDQVHALKSYFNDQQFDAWVYRCVFLQGIDGLAQAGTQLSGVIGLRSSGADVLTALVGTNFIRRRGSEFVVSSVKQDRIDRVFSSPIFKEIIPSRLDRLKMDRISAQPEAAKIIAQKLGNQRVHIRGHGGTGKTIMMLQAAIVAHQVMDKRCLVLTYNVALAADIQRLLAMLRVPDRVRGAITVRTSMSFISSWLTRLGVASSTDDLLQNYSKSCELALDAIKIGALGRGDLDKVISSDPSSFEYDAIIIDEAQDWPQPEADLVCSIYGAEKIAIADGIDQLVRGQSTDWKRTLPKGQSSEGMSLAKCLRMKRNLGIFANLVAQAAGLNWEVVPNDQAAGGKVILAAGSYGSMTGLRQRLIQDAQAAGNENIDFLHCVPSSEVESFANTRCSKLANALEAEGFSVWDGVNPQARRDFPRSVDEFRIIQYESCRGLEGWVTVLDGFDKFWHSKFEEAMKATLAEEYQGASPRAISILTAWRWALIPLTRPIDTLVITCREPASEFSRILFSIANENPDFISIEK